MKKNIIIKSIITFMLCFAFLPYVKASGEFKAGDSTYDSISAAIDAINAGEKITLLANYDSGASEINSVSDSTKSFVFDLNGFEISGKTKNGVFLQRDGVLTIIDSSKDQTGKITSKNTNEAIGVYGGAKVIINGGTITGGNTGIYLYVGASKEKGNKLEVNGGTIAANFYSVAAFDYDEVIINAGTLTSHGYVLLNNGSDAAESTFTINGGKLIQLDDDQPAIYHPGPGTLTVNGGEIIGGSGIEMRAGKLVIPSNSTAKITANYKGILTKTNANGGTTKGAAIAVVQHVTKNPIEVIIENGTFEGYAPFFQANPENNDQDALNKIFLSIKGGKFDTINDGTDVVSSTNFESFITGGSYNLELLDKYILLPYVKVKKADSRYYVELKTENKIEEIDPTKQTKDPQVGVTEEQKGALEEIIKETIKNNEIIFDEVRGKEIEIVLDIDENKDVQGKESFEKKLDKGAVGLGYFDIDINVYEKDTTNLLSRITETEDKIKLSVVIPNNLPELKEGYTRKFYIVREHEGEYELLEGTSSKDGKSFEFESNKFSTFLLAYSDVKNPKTADSVISYIAYTLLGISLFGACVLYLNNVSKKKNI